MYVVWVSLKADRTRPHSSDSAVCGAVVRSEHANYDRRALIIGRYTVATVKTAQTDRTLSVSALPQDRFNIK